MDMSQIESALREELTKAHALPVHVLDRKTGHTRRGVPFRRVPEVGEHVLYGDGGRHGGTVTEVANYALDHESPFSEVARVTLNALAAPTSPSVTSAAPSRAPYYAAGAVAIALLAGVGYYLYDESTKKTEASTKRVKRAPAGATGKPAIATPAGTVPAPTPPPITSPAASPVPSAATSPLAAVAPAAAQAASAASQQAQNIFGPGLASAISNVPGAEGSDPLAGSGV